MDADYHPQGRLGSVAQVVPRSTLLMSFNGCAGLPSGGAGGGIPASGPVAQSPLDIAIDPDEPTYCTCRQVSFGEMIACDNDACPIEWYHQSCVGFKPSEKFSKSWFCPLCRAV